MDTAKDHTVCIFDGASMDYRMWKEKMELYIMANRLYSGILKDEDPGDKKTLSFRSLACYAIISLNLSDSARDVIRRLDSKDPKVCWEVLSKAFDRESPSTKLVLLDLLIELKAQGSMIAYVSEFNVTVSRLRSMGIKFDEELLVALFLRGLPPQYDVFCSTVRHGESAPRVDEIFIKLYSEENFKR
jgi:hypothetical protein